MYKLFKGFIICLVFVFVSNFSMKAEAASAQFVWEKTEIDVPIFSDINDYKNQYVVKFYVNGVESKDFEIEMEVNTTTFSTVLTNGNAAKLGEYNDLSDGYTLLTDIFTISIDDIEGYEKYCNNKEALEIMLLNLNVYMEINKEKSTADRVVFDSPIVKVRKNGKDVPFDFFKDGQGYHAKIG